MASRVSVHKAQWRRMPTGLLLYFVRLLGGGGLGVVVDLLQSKKSGMLLLYGVLIHRPLGRSFFGHGRRMTMTMKAPNTLPTNALCTGPDERHCVKRRGTSRRSYCQCTAHARFTRHVASRTPMSHRKILSQCTSRQKFAASVNEVKSHPNAGATAHYCHYPCTRLEMHNERQQTIRRCLQSQCVRGRRGKKLGR